MKWFIGDVHGCFLELTALIKKINKKDPMAEIILLGDLFDRGPTFERIFTIFDEHKNVKSLLGNHELNFVQEQIGIKPCNSNARRLNHDLFEQFDDKQKEKVMRLLCSFQKFVSFSYADKDRFSRVIGSHSIIRDFENLVYIRRHEPIPLDYGNAWTFCSRNAAINVDNLPIYEDNACSYIAFHGHQSFQYVDIYSQVEDMYNRSVKVFNIDSGCVYGGFLTAMCAETLDIIQIEAYKEYAKHPGAKK